MKGKVDAAIVGAGQAGLATSWYLTQAGVEHVILESGCVAETWRSRRWDSFCLVTPNWSVNLPGAKYAGPDPGGYMPLMELVDYFQSWADSFGAPVEERCAVSALNAGGDGFELSLPDGKLRARIVVVATGGYQRAHRPAGGEQIPRGVVQILAEEYGNPDRVPPGAVLIVGSGQTGCQLAEELHESGRRVLLACGRCPWGPRRIDGRDVFWWAAESGFLDRTPNQLPSPAARLVANIVTTGHGGGHDLHLRTLHEDGVELLGHFVGASDGELHFADDLASIADFGDARLTDLWKYIDRYCEKMGVAAPPFEAPAPFRIKTRTNIDVRKDGISAVIWTSGYRPDYAWVHVPVFDDMGFPLQVDGRSPVPGLYFMGVHYQRKTKSAILWGVAEDAELVARHIAENST